MSSGDKPLTENGKRVATGLVSLALLFLLDFVWVGNAIRAVDQGTANSTYPPHHLGLIAFLCQIAVPFSWLLCWATDSRWHWIAVTTAVALAASLTVIAVVF